ncbi:hypothetical protein K450DRAFT_264129 [Umbelopsis ramanniana AG]|uniref:Uncharacterized protein n=1 Tax=Umbelopsis ramanniana AG TaxID=1314678 RepID=A0AAD5E166_UMBRA|nr:hypothetical protein K450DRAFT_264129 [Umbelopsis ramanniana AG]
MKPFCFRRMGFYPFLRYSCQHSLFDFFSFYYLDVSVRRVVHSPYGEIWFPLGSS